MSALGAFMATWSQARATFGEGTPSDGSQFDQSSQFSQLRSQVESAAPGSSWSGSASDSYAESNSQQAQRLGNVGDLDRQLGAEVRRSAAVVTAGRRDLDTVKQWVSDAACAVPKTAAGQRMLWPIVSKGSADLQDILTRSNSELSSIASRMRGLGNEYETLRRPHPLAPTEETDPQGPDPAELAEFWLNWNDLQARIADHNSVIPPPPSNTPAGIRYESERQELEIEQAQMLVEAAELGLQILSPTNAAGG